MAVTLPGRTLICIRLARAGRDVLALCLRLSLDLCRCCRGGLGLNGGAGAIVGLLRRPCGCACITHCRVSCACKLPDLTVALHTLTQVRTPTALTQLKYTQTKES